MKIRKCNICGDEYTLQDIHDLRDMHEDYFHSKEYFICPDCYANLNGMGLEDQLRIFLEKELND